MPSQPAPLPLIRLELLVLQLQDGSAAAPLAWLLITPPVSERAAAMAAAELLALSSSRFFPRPANDKSQKTGKKKSLKSQKAALKVLCMLCYK